MTFVSYIKVLLFSFVLPWTWGQQGQELSRILWRGIRRHCQSTVKPVLEEDNRFRDLEWTPCIASLRIISWTSSLFLSIKIWSIYLVKCVLTYGKRVIDSRGILSLPSWRQGGKKWQSLSQQQRTRKELLFWTLTKAAWVELWRKHKNCPGMNKIQFITGMPTLTGQPLQL